MEDPARLASAASARTTDGSSSMTVPHNTTAAAAGGGSDFRAFLRILRRRSVLIGVCFLLATASAVVFSLSESKEYSASASLLFRDPQLDTTLFGSTYLAPSNDPQREAATNAKLVSLAVVSARTAKKIDHGVTPATVQDEVSIQAEGQSNLVSITATDRDPNLAARIPNTFAEQYIQFRREADRSKISDAQKLVQT